jgi:hypothetical protein
MKKLFLLLCLGCCFAGFQNTLFAGNKDGRILIYASLTGAQENPPVTTKARGLVTFMLEEDLTTVTMHGVFDSLSGPITGIHLHQGFQGANGSVVLNLQPYLKGNNAIYGKAQVPKALLGAVMARNIYINVHTAANPNGEIRGQLIVDSDLHFMATMGGENEVPAVTGSGVGAGSFTLDPTGRFLKYYIQVSGLTGAITAAHLHYGATTVSGGVAVALNRSGNTLSGTIDILTITTTNFLDSLFRGRVYANIHTAANSTGEIRGQLNLNSYVNADAILSGANEVPSVTTTAKGLFICWADLAMDTLNYFAVYDSITPTAAHIHFGAANGTGGVMQGLTAVAGRRAYAGRIGVKPDSMARMLKGTLYVNVHSTAFPNGEIRGQLNTSVRDAVVANLCPKQENPPVTNAPIGRGAGFCSVNRDKTDGLVQVVVSSMSANPTAGHIHAGGKTVNGAVVINLGMSGGVTRAAGVFSITRSTFADSIVNGLTYLNVHSALNPTGEIRGQLAKELQNECLPTGVYELNGAQLKVEVFPNPMIDKATLRFDSNDDFKAQIIVSDILGRQIQAQNVSILRGANQMDLNVADWARGIYFIQLRNANRLFFTEKMLKE